VAVSTLPADGTALAPSTILFKKATDTTCPIGTQVVYLALRYMPYEGYTLPLRVSSTAMGAVRACTRDAGRSRALEWVWGLTQEMKAGAGEQEPSWAIRAEGKLATYAVLAMKVEQTR
jgi:hypothetical protein